MTTPPKKTYSDQEKVNMLLQLCASMNLAATRTIQRLGGVGPENSLTLPGTVVQEILKDMETVLKGAVSFSTLYQKAAAKTAAPAPAAPPSVEQSLQDITRRVKTLTQARRAAPAAPAPAPEPAKPASLLERIMGPAGWIAEQCFQNAPLPGLVPLGLPDKPWKPSQMNGLPAFQDDLLAVAVDHLKHYPQGYYHMGTTDPRIPRQLFLTQGKHQYLICRDEGEWNVYFNKGVSWSSFKVLSESFVKEHFEDLQLAMKSALYP